MKKRLLSVLLTICMVLTMLPTVAFATSAIGITVAGVTLNENTPYWEKGEAKKTVSEDVYAYFDSADGTLYLNGVIIENDDGYGIEAVDESLTIVCNGTNTIKGSTDGIHVSSDVLTIKGDGSLSVRGIDRYGIYSQGTITAENDRSLTINGKTYGIYDHKKVDIHTKGDVSINAEEIGIYVDKGNINIASSSGKVTITADGDAVLLNKGTANISADNDVTIKGGGYGSYGSYGIISSSGTSDVIVESKNGSVNIEGSSSGVLVSESGVNISANKGVKIVGKDGSGIIAKSAVTVTDAVYISITGKVYGINVFGSGDVTLDTGGKLRVNGGEDGINCRNGKVYISGEVEKDDELQINNDTYVPSDKTLTNNGTITVTGDKTFTVDGQLVNNGTITPEPFFSPKNWIEMLSDELTWSDHITKSGNTYTVKSAEGLAWVAGVTNGDVEEDSFDNDPNMPNMKSFKGNQVIVANDIDLKEHEWVPIGVNSDIDVRFGGNFDGGRYKISNMNTNDQYVGGLFGLIGEDAVVHDFSISGRADAKGDDSTKGRSGGVAADNCGTISNVISNVNVSASGSGTCVGGIAGCNAGTIQNCISLGNVSGETFGSSSCAGGICGSNHVKSSLVQNCYSKSSVKTKGDFYVGALVGDTRYYKVGTVKNSYWYDGSTQTKGVGDSGYSESQVSSIGKFTAVDEPLIKTDGTELEYNGNLISALNKWVSNKNDNNLRAWAVNSNVNNGYPVHAEKINYELNEGIWRTGYNAPTAYIEGVITELPTAANIKREGYTFYGWTKSESDTAYFSEISTTQRENITLYAKWEKESEGLTFKEDTESISKEGYSWNKDTKTLTLNGLKLKIDSGTGIILPDDATLVIEGTNNIIATDGIHVNGTLNIMGKGMLNVQCTDDGIYTPNGDITISGGTIKITTVEENGRGIYIPKGDMKISGGTLNIHGETFGMELESGNIEISGGTLNINDAMFGMMLESGKIKISDGTLNVNGKICGMASFNGNIEISGGTSTIEAEQTAMAVAFFSKTNTDSIPQKIIVDTEKLMITGGSLVSTEWTEAEDGGYMAYNTFSESGEVIINGDSITGASTKIVIKLKPIISKSYKVIFNTKAGAAVTSQTIIKDNKVIKPSDPTKTGYTFNGWYTDETYKTAWDFDKDTITKDIILYSKWTQNSSGGGSGSGGGSTKPSTPNISSPKTNNEAGTTTVTTEIKPVVKGATATATVDEKTITNAVKEAVNAAKKEDTKANVAIKIDAPKGTEEVTAQLPVSAIKAVADSKAKSMTTSTPIGNMTFDNKALDAIVSQSETGNVSISIAKAGARDISKEDKEKIGDRPVYRLSIKNGDKIISDFNGGKATISIPYTLKSNEKPEGIVVYYIDGSGKLNKVEGAKYDEKTGAVSFTTTHFSLYAISYEEVVIEQTEKWVNPFADVQEEAWYYEAVKYAVENRMFTGTSDQTFSPNTAMTRGMLVTVLYHLASAESDDLNTFKDVENNAWYTKAVAWAAANNIVGGYEDGLFGPNDPITREQMASILYRYAKAQNMDVSISISLDSFRDANNTSSYAKEAMEWAVGEKLISGKGNNTLDPTGTTTRAEGASILMRFIENTIK